MRRRDKATNKKKSRSKWEMDWNDIGTYAGCRATMMSIQYRMTQKIDNSFASKYEAVRGFWG